MTTWDPLAPNKSPTIPLPALLPTTTEPVAVDSALLPIAIPVPALASASVPMATESA